MTCGIVAALLLGWLNVSPCQQAAVTQSQGRDFDIPMKEYDLEVWRGLFRTLPHGPITEHTDLNGYHLCWYEAEKKGWGCVGEKK